MNWNRFIEDLFKLAEPYLETRGDLLHTQVAHKYSLFLLEEEEGDKGIVEPAVILHDVGWSRLKPEEIKVAYGVRAAGENAKRLNRVHELEGAKIARALLNEKKYDPALTDRIALIIERHDSGKETDSLEEKVVKDSDRLWRFSKVGYYQEMERQSTDSEERFRFLSKHLGTWFFTETARKVADEELKKRLKETGNWKLDNNLN
jgi:HD superfamily phosphodiesterase